MIHSCSYYCHKPECIKAQRDELRDKLFKREWVGLTDEEEFELDEKYGDDFNVYIDQRDMKLKEKNT